MSAEEASKPTEFNGFIYVADKTSISKRDSTGKEVAHIKTGDIIDNKLYATKDGIYFKVHDIYYGLHHDERVR